MAKKKVDEPFVQMFELKGLKANEALMVCKVWSFQSNGLECFISNRSWANYLGCSPKTINRIKCDLEELGIIERDDQYLRLKCEMQILIDILDKNYTPKYKKTIQKLPYWHDENNQHNDNTDNQNEPTPSQNEPTPGQVERQFGQNDNQLYKEVEKVKENIKDNFIPETWSLSNFILSEVTSIDQIDFDITDKVELRNLVLSYWYNCFSTVELVEPINLFLDENYFNIFTKVLRSIPLGKLNINFLIGVDINCFFVFIKASHTSEQEFSPKGSIVPLRHVVSLIISSINDQKEGFKTFLNPNQK
jgi:hypothetical protein